MSRWMRKRGEKREKGQNRRLFGDENINNSKRLFGGERRKNKRSAVMARHGTLSRRPVKEQPPADMSDVPVGASRRSFGVFRV